MAGADDGGEFVGGSALADASAVLMEAQGMVVDGVDEPVAEAWVFGAATRSGQSAAVHADLLAAAEHLRCVLDALSRTRTNDSVGDLDAEAPREQEEALKDIYGLALDGWFEFDAPGSTMTDDWLRRLVEDERLPMATARAAAVVMAAREVYDAAVAASCDGDRPADEAMRSMVRGALHVLGPEVLRGLLATSPSSHHVRYLREISSEALAAGNLERVIAAVVIPMAGGGVGSD